MTLQSLRRLSAYMLSISGAVMGLCVLVSEYVMQPQVGVASGVALVLIVVLAGTFVFARNSLTFRYVAVTVLMANVALLLVAARGHPWQMDMHMAFFAALALSALTYDVRVLLLGTALVAVHHLGLGLFMENLVFYGEGNLSRILLHAVILVAEAAGLIWLTRNTHALLRLADEKTQQAASEAEKVLSMSDAAQQERTRNLEGHAAMMERLEASFGKVVEQASKGRFESRIAQDFEDETLNRLAAGVNNLVSVVDRGLSETGEVLAALADTDLTRRVKGAHEGAFMRLKDDTNAVADRLSDVLGQLRETSRALKLATGEILSGANDLSERTTKQAATIETTSAAIEKLASTVIENANRAQDASGSAKEVSKTAQEGAEVMHQANGAMERITSSSAKISNIIGMIDDIAFQTNLLALNASVEAARAGEAGKGFAVVAVEVRRLAQSAAEASSEVKVLIEKSGIEVNSGSKLVANAADKLESMLEAARKSNALMDSIARESREQAASIEDVNAAVQQMDQMTQHNASLVEEMNVSIRQTEAQATDLDRIVDIFRIGKTTHAAAPVSLPVKPDTGVRGLQQKVMLATKSYLSKGNAAIDKEWSEF